MATTERSLLLSPAVTLSFSLWEELQWVIPSEALAGGGAEDGIPLLSLWQRWAGKKQQQQRQRGAMGGCVAWRERWGGCGGRAALTSRGEVAQREGEWERESGETAEGTARHRHWAPGTGKGCPGTA